MGDHGPADRRAVSLVTAYRETNIDIYLALIHRWTFVLDLYSLFFFC